LLILFIIFFLLFAFHFDNIKSHIQTMLFRNKSMPLITAIRTKNDLSNLTDACKQLLLNKNTIQSITTGDEAGNSEATALQQAKLIVSEMLGFVSVEDMHSHYDNIVFYRSDLFSHSRAKGEDSHTVWTKEGIELSIADLIAFGIIEGNQVTLDERIEDTGNRSELRLKSEIPEFELIIEDYHVAATRFPPRSKDFFALTEEYKGILHDNPQSVEQAFKTYFHALVDIYLEADSSGYEHSDITFLKQLEENDVEYPIAEQSDFASIGSLLQWVTATFAMGCPVELEEDHKERRGILELTSSDLEGDLHIIYDIELKIFAVIHDGNLIKSISFTTHEEDVRMEAYRNLLK
jgi:hypothetical protein